jgi:gas vesicle protein
LGDLIGGIGRFLAGAAVGAAVGTALGTLFAPARGEELKRRLAQRLSDIQTAGEQAERETIEHLRREYRQHVAKREG